MVHLHSHKVVERIRAGAVKPMFTRYMHGKDYREWSETIQRIGDQIEQAHKFFLDFEFRIDPEVTASYAALSEMGLNKLPFNTCWIETHYPEISTKSETIYLDRARCGVLAQGVHNDIDEGRRYVNARLFVWGPAKQHNGINVHDTQFNCWINPKTSLWPDLIVTDPDKQLSESEKEMHKDIIGRQAMAVYGALVLSLNTRWMEKEEKPAPHRLNKKRVAKGKPKVDGFTVVRAPRVAREAQGGTHASPRVHIRRGHVRKQRCGVSWSEYKTIFIEPTLVNAEGEEMIAPQEYLVTEGPNITDASTQE